MAMKAMRLMKAMRMMRALKAMKAMKVQRKSMRKAMKRAMKRTVMKKGTKEKAATVEVLAPKSKSGVGKAFVRPSWLSSQDGLVVKTVPIDVCGIPELILRTTTLHLKMGFCPNIHRKDTVGTVHVLKNINGIITWIKKSVAVTNASGTSSSASEDADEDSEDSEENLLPVNTGIGKREKRRVGMAKQEANAPSAAPIDVRGISQVMSERIRLTCKLVNKEKTTRQLNKLYCSYCFLCIRICVPLFFVAAG